MKKYGGRRFLLTLLLCLAYIALLVGGYLDQGSFVALQMMTAGAYLTANGHQKHMEISNARVPTEVPETNS